MSIACLIVGSPLIKIAAAASVGFSLLLGGCGGDSRYVSGPTSNLEACLKAAGARIATTSRDLAFAEGQSYRADADAFGPDNSGTLSVGSYGVPGAAGWEIYYVVRKGYRLSLDAIVRHPEKTAKVVAFVNPADSAKVQAANECL